MNVAKIIKENKGSTYNVDDNSYGDIDLTQFSDEELSALGIDPASVEREEEEEEDLEDDDIGDELDEDEEDEDSKEDDEESDDEDSSESDEDESEEDEEPKKDIRIPKARFDEAVQKERRAKEEAEARTKTLEDQVERLLQLQEAQLKTTTEQKVEEVKVDVDELETKYAEALLSGETNEAVKIRNKINLETQKIINHLLKEAKETAKEEANNISNVDKFNLAIETAYNKYSFLMEDDPNYNEELVSEINAMAVGFTTTEKLSRADALTKAVSKLAPVYKKSITPTKKSKEVITRKRSKASKVAKEPLRAKATNIKDITPDEIDWDKMSEAEFDELADKHPSIIKNYLNGIHS